MTSTQNLIVGVALALFTALMGFLHLVAPLLEAAHTIPR